MDWIEQNSKHAWIRKSYEKIVKKNREKTNLERGVYTKVDSNGNRTQHVDLRTYSAEDEEPEPSEDDPLGQCF